MVPENGHKLVTIGRNLLSHKASLEFECPPTDEALGDGAVFMISYILIDGPKPCCP
jgi:hypothetical protein